MDNDDLPGYLIDAYRSAIDHSLQHLLLVRVGTGENKMWQASSRFPRSKGYHVEIEADPFEAVMKALGAWTRVEKGLDDSPASKGETPAPEPTQEAGGLFD